MSNTDKLIEKASVLMEALPYIRRFYGKRIVIKYGGSAMVDEDLKEHFALDIIMMKYIGLNPVVVHGGGPQIGKILDRMGKKSHFVKGMRVTDRDTIDIVEMVLVGKVNTEIVGLINYSGGSAVGLSGKDGKFIVAKKLDSSKLINIDEHQEMVDLGMVGEVVKINPGIIEALEAQNFIPVIAPIGIGEEGESYNINADLAAGKIASALKAKKLILLTDKEGVLDRNNKLISTMETNESIRFIRDGTVSGGMIPKVECCVEAIQEGVDKAHIIDGRLKHAILLEIFTDRGIGTEII